MYAYHTHVDPPRERKSITMHGMAWHGPDECPRVCVVWVCGTFCTLILARQIILALIFITHSDTFQNYAQTN